jgi:hypothetical protein
MEEDSIQDQVENQLASKENGAPWLASTHIISIL